MMRTVRAIINEQGLIELLEPIELSGPHQALVTILDDTVETLDLRPYGLCEGEFSVPSDFDECLPEDILQDFESR